MFKKRTLIKKKRSFKRRTPGGGVVTRPSLYRSLNSERRQIHKHVMGYVYTTALNTQTGWSGTVNSQSIQFFFVFDGLWVQVGGNAAVFVGSFDNTAYLTGIYEKYRIKKVVCEIVCGSNNSPVNSTTQFSTTYGVIDNNDANPLSSVTKTIAYDNCKLMQFGANTNNNGKHTLYLNNPTAIGDMESTGATGIAAGKHEVSPWLNTANSNIPHFGIKLYNTFLGGAASTQYVQVGEFRRQSV